MYTIGALVAPDESFDEEGSDIIFLLKLLKSLIAPNYAKLRKSG
jgi:hypothetical protein